MSSQCFCNRFGEDDFVCLCFDSEEELDEEVETVDDNIDGGGTDIARENFGIEIPCTVTQSCFRTAVAGCSDTGNTKVSHLFNGEFENDKLGTKLGNNNLGNGDLMNTNLAICKNDCKSIEKFRPNVSVSLTSFEAKDLREQPSSVLEHNSTLDPQTLLLNDDSRANKKQCHFNEDAQTEYEWQFQEKDGSWVSYDINNAIGGSQSIPKMTTTMSQNIERYRKSRPIPIPIFFRKNHRRCVLDLLSMTEHDTEDGTDRPIRRVPKMTPTITGEIKSVAGNRVPENNAASPGMGFLRSSVPENNETVEVDFCPALPSYWTPVQEGASFITVPLNTSCAEYEILITEKSDPTLRVAQITRIQNIEHYRAYQKRTAALKLQFPDVHFREEVLFHGTKSENVESVSKENFNWRLFGKANGHALCRGV